MKKISLPLFCVAVFLTFSAVSAQEISKPVLVDETGYDIHGEGLLARLDHFAVRLQNNNERGTILLFMNEDSIKNVFIYRFLQSYPATRRIGNLFKIIWLTETNLNELWQEKWNSIPPVVARRV